MSLSVASEVSPSVGPAVSSVLNQGFRVSIWSRHRPFPTMTCNLFIQMVAQYMPHIHFVCFCRICMQWQRHACLFYLPVCTMETMSLVRQTQCTWKHVPMWLLIILLIYSRSTNWTVPHCHRWDFAFLPLSMCHVPTCLIVFFSATRVHSEQFTWMRDNSEPD